MYHILSIEAGKSVSPEAERAFEKVMFCWRRMGSEPGQLASSMESRASVWLVMGMCVPSVLMLFGSGSWNAESSRAGKWEEDEGRAVGSLGWEIEFWPVMVSPLDKPARMWWEKFVLMAGRTETV